MVARLPNMKTVNNVRQDMDLAAKEADGSSSIIKPTERTSEYNTVTITEMSEQNNAAISCIWK